MSGRCIWATSLRVRRWVLNSAAPVSAKVEGVKLDDHLVSLITANWSDLLIDEMDDADEILTFGEEDEKAEPVDDAGEIKDEGWGIDNEEIEEDVSTVTLDVGSIACILWILANDLDSEASNSNPEDWSEPEDTVRRGEDESGWGDVRTLSWANSEPEEEEERDGREGDLWYAEDAASEM